MEKLETKSTENESALKTQYGKKCEEGTYGGI